MAPSPKTTNWARIANSAPTTKTDSIPELKGSLTLDGEDIVLRLTQEDFFNACYQEKDGTFVPRTYQAKDKKTGAVTVKEARAFKVSFSGQLPDDAGTLRLFTSHNSVMSYDRG